MEDEKHTEHAIVHALFDLTNPTVNEARQVITANLAPLGNHNTFFVLFNLSNAFDSYNNDNVIKIAVDLEYAEFLQKRNNHHDPAQEHNNDQEHSI